MMRYRIEVEISAETEAEANAVGMAMLDIAATVIDGPYVLPAPGDVSRLCDVMLMAPGMKKIQVIKEVRAIVRGLGLKEAKDLVDASATGEQVVLSNVSSADARVALEALEAAGAAARIEANLSPKEVKAARQSTLKIYRDLSKEV